MAEIIGIHSTRKHGVTQEPAAPEPLWREVLGSRLRAMPRHGETLAQTAERAGISPQYLSEIERGRKEPSSEMIAALAGALGHHPRRPDAGGRRRPAPPLRLRVGSAPPSRRGAPASASTAQVRIACPDHPSPSPWPREPFPVSVPPRARWTPLGDPRGTLGQRP